MNIRWIILGFTGLLLGGVVVFLLWDRIVDGPFPHKSKGERFFAQRQPALDAFIERLNADDRVGKVTCYADEVWLEGSDDAPRVELSGERREEYLTLCRSAGVSTGWRHDGEYHLYMGGDRRNGRDFQIALVWHEQGIDEAVDCSSLSELGDTGECDIPLTDAWSIRYEWIPKL